MRGLATVAISILLTGAAAAHTVSAVDGRIVLEGRPVTTGGRDADPVLSPDGKRIVFSRSVPGRPLTDCSGAEEIAQRIELWTVGANGTGARRLLGLRPDKDMGKTICAFDNAQFSSDGRRLYFETPAWATSGAVHVYDFGSGKERLFKPGGGLKVLNRCKDRDYRDHLIIGQHRYFVFGGSYDWAYLFSPDGKEIGPLGDGDFTQALEDACG